MVRDTLTILASITVKLKKKNIKKNSEASEIRKVYINFFFPFFNPDFLKIVKQTQRYQKNKRRKIKSISDYVLFGEEDS